MSSRSDKEDVYTALDKGDLMWLEKKSDQLGITRSEALRKIVHNARIREQYDDEFIV